MPLNSPGRIVAQNTSAWGQRDPHPHIRSRHILLAVAWQSNPRDAAPGGMPPWSPVQTGVYSSEIRATRPGVHGRHHADLTASAPVTVGLWLPRNAPSGGPVERLLAYGMGRDQQLNTAEVNIILRSRPLFRFRKCLAAKGGRCSESPITVGRFT